MSPPTNRPLRTVIVGFGQVSDGLSEDPRMARWFPRACHAQVLADHPAFAWEAVVDPDPAARARARERWGIPHVAASLAELAGRYDPEVAVLAGPPASRLEALEALPDLRGAMVEKPLGPDLARARALLEAGRGRRLPLQVNLWRRGVATFAELASGGLQARLGTVQAGLALYGNGLRNNGSHLIDLLTFLLGPVARLAPLGPIEPLAAPPLPGDAHRAFALSFASGPTVCCQPLDFAHYREVGLDLWGTRGRLSLLQESLCLSEFPLADNRGLMNEREIASDRPQRTEVRVADAFTTLYDNLAAAIHDPATALLSPAEAALETEALLEQLLA